MTALSAQHMGELFKPSGTAGLHLFHADPSDRIWRIPDAIGRGYVQEIDLGNGLSLVILDCHLTQALLKNVALFRPSLEFEFCLMGAEPGTNLTILHPGDRNSIHLPAGQRYLWIEVFVTAPRLEPYFHGLLNQLSPHLRHLAWNYFQQIDVRQLDGDRMRDATELRLVSSAAPTPQVARPQVQHSSTLPPVPSAISPAPQPALQSEIWLEVEQVLSAKTTSAMQTVLHQILNCPHQGLVRQLYLESNALALVSLRLEQIYRKSQTAVPRKTLQPEDVEKIHQAREILRRQLINPPSLIALARQAGLNDCTLKRGFRQVFGMTAFECLYHDRMQQAQQLLESGKLAVSQVATAVGYTSRSSFYTAFRKQFGVGPSEYLTQRRKNSG